MDTPKPMQGTWTLTAPDGRTWQAESPLRVVAMESRERVPAAVALARINAARWCGYCQRGIADCVCPPWMPNTGTEKERAERAIRTGWIEQMTPQARRRTVAVAARIDGAALPAEATPDAELLDWLDANNGAWMSDEKCLWHGEWPKRRAVHAATLREAIRAASLATPD